MSGKRRAGRILALKGLYPTMVDYMNPQDPRESFDALVKVDNYSREVVEFASGLIGAVSEHLKKIDGLIQKVVENWEWDRMCAVDKAILAIAVAEFLYFHENPPKVVINEAIEIGKEYSTEKSGMFINGLLDRIARELKIL